MTPEPSPEEVDISTTWGRTLASTDTKLACRASAAPPPAGGAPGEGLDAAPAPAAPGGWEPAGAESDRREGAGLDGEQAEARRTTKAREVTSAGTARARRRGRDDGRSDMRGLSRHPPPSGRRARLGRPTPWRARRSSHELLRGRGGGRHEPTGSSLLVGPGPVGGLNPGAPCNPYGLAGEQKLLVAGRRSRHGRRDRGRPGPIRSGAFRGDGGLLLGRRSAVGHRRGGPIRRLGWARLWTGTGVPGPPHPAGARLRRRAPSRCRSGSPPPCSRRRVVVPRRGGGDGRGGRMARAPCRPKASCPGTARGQPRLRLGSPRPPGPAGAGARGRGTQRAPGLRPLSGVG